MEQGRGGNVHPHTQLKSQGFPTPISSMQGFPVKTRTSSNNTHGGEFICHLYPTLFTWVI